MDDYQHHRLTQALGHADGATPITVNAGDLRAALEAAVRAAELEPELDEALAQLASARADLDEALAQLASARADLEESVPDFAHEMVCASLREAINAWPEFDAQDEVDGGDLVEWFAEWRAAAKKVLEDHADGC